MSATVYFVTTNPGKIKNAQSALKRFDIKIKPIHLEMPESRAEDPLQIAIEKAQFAYSKVKKPIIVEDSGFFINALNGFPMTHIKFSLHTLGIKNILKLLKGVNDRSAEWRMSVAFCYGKNKIKTFTFIEKGEISKNIRPNKRETMSDYWYIYIPKMLPDNKLALSEMTDKTLNEWREYYDTHNQFLMFGKWYGKNMKLLRLNK